MTTAAKAQPAEPNAFAALGDALESAAERFEEGSAHARKSAKQAAGTVSRAFKIGVYNTAYWLSYGVVYSTVFLTELLPEENTLRRGLEEGADAALDATGKPRIEDVEAETEVEAEPAPKAKRTRKAAAPKETEAKVVKPRAPRKKKAA